ncbi:MAG: hypothetical protein HC770_04450, partial [Pseudanabaena sp. CRU_2_10]|nr:hypothetical protein [Pseudanabaena sp. CRU_2_10]
MHTNTLLLIAGSGVTAVCAALMPSILYAQIAIGESGSHSSSSVPLSQQTLLEMRPTSSSLSSGSMEFLRFGKDVTVTPVENVKSALDWISGGTVADKQEVKASPEQSFNRAIANFKEQQKAR